MINKTFKSKIKNFGLILSIFLISSLAAGQKNTLKEILSYALTEDPSIREAKANMSVAQAQTKISEAGHLPIISLANTQMLAQKHRDNRDEKDSTIGVRGQLNLFAWGGIEASVDRDRSKEGFYYYKLLETREQLGLTIGNLYLSAIRAKDLISVYKRSLMRHQKMLHDIQIIASYDPGRESEIIEIESRLFNVQSTIAEQERILNTSLSKLSRYINRSVTINNLQDPFSNINSEQFIARYRNKNLSENPSFKAQQKELESTQAGVRAARAKRLPAINLEGSVNNKNYEVYLGVSWDIFNQANSYGVEQSMYSQEAAHSKLNNIMLDVEEQSRTSQIEMHENSQRLKIIKQQINSQKKVVNTYEQQFKIATRSLLDVLISYQELTNIEVSEVNISADFRDAALSYLATQSNIASWAGIIKLNIPTK